MRPNSGCSAARLAHLLWEQGVPGSNPGTPTKPREQKRCRKTSFCFYAVLQVYLQAKAWKTKVGCASNLFVREGFKCPCGEQYRKGVKRSRRSLRSSQSWYPDKTEKNKKMSKDIFLFAKVLSAPAASSTGKALSEAVADCGVANPGTPTKPREQKRCRKTSFCFFLESLENLGWDNFQFSVFSFQFSVLHSLFSVLYSLYSILYSLYSVLCTLYSVLTFPCEPRAPSGDFRTPPRAYRAPTRSPRHPHSRGRARATNARQRW